MTRFEFAQRLHQPVVFGIGNRWLIEHEIPVVVGVDFFPQLPDLLAVGRRHRLASGRRCAGMLEPDDFLAQKPLALHAQATALLVE